MRNDTMQALGNALGEIRRQKNLTADDLARSSGIAPEALRAMEAARRPIHSADLLRLSQALDAPLLEFFGADTRADVRI